MLTLLTWDGGGGGRPLGGVGGWDDTWLSDGQGGLRGDGDLRWSTLVVRALGDGHNSGLWAVGGETSDGSIGGDGGLVRVSSQSGSRKGGDSSDGRELHFSE